MSSRGSHYKEAERLLGIVDKIEAQWSEGMPELVLNTVIHVVNQAQVHATLANVNQNVSL